LSKNISQLIFADEDSIILICILKNRCHQNIITMFFNDYFYNLFDIKWSSMSKNLDKILNNWIKTTKEDYQEITLAFY
jgi:hypothetical protein